MNNLWIYHLYCYWKKPYRHVTVKVYVCVHNVLRVLECKFEDVDATAWPLHWWTPGATVPTLQSRATSAGQSQLRQISTDFQNSFITGKRRKFPIKPMYHFSHTLIMLPHYLGEFKSSNLSQIWKKMQIKMPHKPVKFPKLSEEEKPWTIFEFTIFIVLSINERRSNS